MNQKTSSSDESCLRYDRVQGYTGSEPVRWILSRLKLSNQQLVTYVVTVIIQTSCSRLALVIIG